VLALPVGSNGAKPLAISKGAHRPPAAAARARCPAPTGGTRRLRRRIWHGECGEHSSCRPTGE